MSAGFGHLKSGGLETTINPPSESLNAANGRNYANYKPGSK